MKRLFTWVSVLVVVGGTSHAASFNLDIVSALSSIDPDVGAAESLSGTLTVRADFLPLAPGQNSNLDATDLLATASGSATITLDAGLANPGLGVVNDAGSFLIPSLFLTFEDGVPLDFTVVDVTGSVVFSPSGNGIRRLESVFDLDSGGPQGILRVTLVAVPEPSTLALSGLALMVLVGGARRRRVGVTR